MKKQADPASPCIWILRSRHTGDNTQLQALAQALGLPAEMKQFAFHPFEWLPRIVLGGTLVSVNRAGSSPLEPPYPDLIIAAGRATEAVAFWIRRHLNPALKLVYVGMPWARLDMFDLVITTPQYRLPARPNVLHNALPLHDIAPERLTIAASAWAPVFAGLPKPRIAVLVGGRTGPYSFEPAAARRLAQAASDRARKLGGALVVTTSARTSPAATQALFASLDAPHHGHRWQAGGVSNPFHAYLDAADEIIVTADSVSMIAEACATGKPTYLFDIEEGRRAMRAEAAGGQSRLPPPYWKGVDLATTLWRLGLRFGPDWWTRDIRIVHRALMSGNAVAWLGEAPPRAGTTDPGRDMSRAVARVRALIQPSHTAGITGL